MTEHAIVRLSVGTGVNPTMVVGLNGVKKAWRFELIRRALRRHHVDYIDEPSNASHRLINTTQRKASSLWRSSSGDPSLSQRRCDKQHPKHRKPSQSALSTTRHSSNIHSSSATPSRPSQHHKMSPHSARLSDEDINKQRTTPLRRATCDSACCTEPAFSAQHC